MKSTGYKDGESTPARTPTGSFLRPTPIPIPSRRLTEETAKVFQSGEVLGKGYVYPYFDRDTGELVAQKVRPPGSKDFYWIGAPSRAGLYGQHRCKAGGPHLCITEGEFDAHAFSQMAMSSSFA